jgi:hypothetical protein
MDTKAELESKIVHLERKIIAKINSFDMFYEMSDSAKVIIKGTDKEAKLNKELKQLSDAAKQTIQDKLTDKGSRVWERYFKNA